MNERSQRVGPMANPPHLGELIRESICWRPQSGRWECRDLVGNDSRFPVVILEMSEVATLASCMLDAANHPPRGPTILCRFGLVKG